MELRRILIAIALTCGTGAAGAGLVATPASAAPATLAQAETSRDDDDDDDDGDDDRRAPRGGVDTGAGGTQDDDDDDDRPRGGVDTGAGGTQDDDDDDDRPRGGVETGAGGTWTGAQAANPVRLRVPAIGLKTKIIPLAIDKKGRLAAPKRYDVAGWNQAGPEPGERGPAVIAGHVDSKTGPAVFYKVRGLDPGDKIHVDRADGTTKTFTVHRLARYPKTAVPSRTVYGQTAGAELRLITCGGVFDRKKGSYRDNIVVFAR
ncbi:class F sortase [Nonomuraea sp. NPDC050790]|uniref:class F sortase n=1 Tax=Nonomuraea sp. NPDC050790 TaxID=3364371 RepID=UPI00379AB2DF